MNKIILGVLGILLAVNITPSRGSYTYSTMTFLTMPVSPAANGVAGVYMPNSVDDPLSMLINPAAVGRLSRSRQFSASAYLSHANYGLNTEIFSSMHMYYSARAVMVGASAAQLSRWMGEKIPVSLGLGYSEMLFDKGKTNRVNEQGQSVGELSAWDRSRGFTIGAGYDRTLQVDFGLSLHRVVSKLEPYKADGYAHDIGIHAQYPLRTLLPAFPNTSARYDYFLTPSVGYALTNFGSGVHYVDDENYTTADDDGDPLPRTAKLTFGLSIGLNYQLLEGPCWQLLALDAAIQGEDELSRIKSDGSNAYRQPLGDIHVFGDLLLGQANNSIEKRKGFALSFLDIMAVRFGSWEVPMDARIIHTSGLGLRLAGVLHMAQAMNPRWTSSKAVAFLLEHVDLAYDESTWHEETVILDYHRQISPFDNMHFRSLNIMIK
jgi:hypothetical protein